MKTLCWVPSAYSAAVGNLSAGIPVELCLSSNVLTGVLWSVLRAKFGDRLDLGIQQMEALENC